MKKIAKLIAISLCLATTTFAMDASFVEESYDERAVLSNLQNALSVIQDVTPEVLQRLVHKKQINVDLTDHCARLCESLLALQEDAVNFGTGLTTFEQILDGLPDAEEVIDPLASFIADFDSSTLEERFIPPAIPGSLQRTVSTGGGNTNQIAAVNDDSSDDES